MLTSISSNRVISSLRRTNYNQIGPASYYSASVMFYIHPSYETGRYNICVHTDYRNDVFEFTYDNNNLRCKGVALQARLPDLIVSDFSYSTETSDRGNLVYVNYTVRNQGPGNTTGAPWVDRLQVAYSLLSSDRGTTLHTYRQRNDLSAGEKYNQGLSSSVPPNVFGSVYLYLFIDSSNQIVEENNQNNVLQSTSFILFPLFPDLSVQSFTIFNSLQVVEGGNEIQITWTITNQGEVVVERQSWYDSIYISSSSPMVESSNAIKLDDYAVSPTILGPQMSYQQTFNVSIPMLLDYSLRYYMILQVNSRNSVNENNRMNNNMANIQVQISAPPSPNLQISHSSFEFFQTSRILAVQWTVRNIGNSMRSTMTWVDQILLSSEPELSHTNAIILGSREQSQILMTDQVYNGRESYFVSPSLAGEFYVYIETDISNSVLEQDGEDNNILQSEGTVVITLPPSITIRVEINQEIVPTILTGQTFILSYTVTNIGQVSIGTTSWIDRVYISSAQNASRSFLLNNGLLLSQNLNNMQLSIGETYTVTVNLTVPHELTGTQFLAIVVDTNDVLNSEVLGSFETTISVNEGPLPDLAGLFVSNNLTLRSGQPTTIEYLVINVGQTSALASWYEALYLSRDALLDPFDTRLKSVPNLGTLGVNGSYIQNVEVFIPYDLPSSYYYVICLVDVRNEIFETSVSNNNMHLLVSIIETVSTDISIANPRVTPNILNYGGSINFEWDIRNNGSLQAVGYKCDSIYLSEDNVWDISDHEIGNPQCASLSIGPYNNDNRNDLNYARSTMVPFIAQQDYYGIVRTRTNIRDPNLLNNIGITETLVEINAPSVTLDIPSTLTLVPNDVQVFKVDDVPEEKTLICTLKTGESTVYHELFLRHNEPPTGYEFDAFSQLALSSSQRAVVRHSRSGTYYIRVESSFSGAQNVQYSAELLIKVAQFEILDISPFVAAPLGNVTIQITGTEFGYSLSASLINSASHVEYTSSRVYWFNSESVYATFDISGAEYGNYSVQLTSTKSGTFTCLNNSFSIIQGIAGQLSVNIIPPRALRSGDIGEVNILLQNTGNVDLLAPLLSLKTGRNAGLRLVDSINPIDFSSQLYFIGLPLNGPGGILLPGATSELTFQIAPVNSRFTGRVSMQLETYNNGSEPHDYINQKSSLKPQAIPIEIWGVIWNNFLSSVGTTRQSFQQRISEIASELSLTGRKVYSVNEIVNYQLRVAYGLLSGMYI